MRNASYFPAANLRQFEGTELSPPGAGTYYNPSRYASFHGNIDRVQRNLANAWQSDLAFNVIHNPNIARSLESERIGAQYGGKSLAGKPGYQTVQLPSGGTTVVTDATAKRLLKNPGYTLAGGATRPSPAAAYQLGFTGEPTGTPRTPFERSYAAGFTGGREGVGVTQPDSGLPPAVPAFYNFAANNLRNVVSGVASIGQRAFEAFTRQFSGVPRLASERDDLNRDIDNTFYGGGHAQPTATPTSTPATTSRLASSVPLGYQSDFLGAPAALQERLGQPRRYFDF